MTGLTMIMNPEQDSTCQHRTSVRSIDEVADRLISMQHQESTTYRCGDYLDAYDNDMMSTQERTIDRDCRSKMVEWSYQVSDFCKFQRESVAMATNYLDRFLATSSLCAQRALCYKKEFQLVAMTSLYISVKLFEPLAMDAGLLAHISHGCYSEVDIIEMEREVLKSLGWMVNGPTVHAFLNHIMELLQASPYGYDDTMVMTILDFSKFQAEIAVCDYDLALEKPSTVALAALMNSIEGIEEMLFPAQSRFQFFHHISEISGGYLDPFSSEVNEIRARLLELFSKNSGYELPQIANLTPVIKTAERCIMDMEFKLSSSLTRSQIMMCSPVSVARNFAANCA